MPPLRPITMRGKQALAAALRAGGASSSSIRDVKEVQHPSGVVPLHIRLQEEYERVTGDRERLQEKRGGYVCPGYPQCENMDCDCAGPQSEEEQEEGGAADWKEDLLNWETMGDDPPETEAADVKESDEEDNEKGQEAEPCICVLCMSEKTYNLYIKDKEKAKDKERGKGKEKGNGKGKGKGKGEVERETVEERRAKIAELQDQWFRGMIHNLAEYEERAKLALGVLKATPPSKEAHEFKSCDTGTLRYRADIPLNERSGAPVVIGPPRTDPVPCPWDEIIRSGGWSDTDTDLMSTDSD